LLVRQFSDLANFVWSLAELLRGAYTGPEYGKVMLPLVILRRLDCVLEPTKAAVLEEAARRVGTTPNPDPFLRAAAQQSFYNTSNFTLTTVLADADQVGPNFRNYLAGFSPGVAEIFDNLGFNAQVDKLEENELLYLMLGKFVEVDLHPETVPSTAMGYVFEELLRRAWSNESAGDHYTPREVIRVMAELLLSGDEDLLRTPRAIRTLYDPACGTGGMLAVAEEYLHELNPLASFELFGQQLLPESYAVCRADMLMKGHDPSRVALGNTLTADAHPGARFDYLLSNPPFGVEWKKEKERVTREHTEQGVNGRFGAGLPRVTDGAFLFLQHMISKMKPVADGGSRIAIVFNSSPLMTGDAGSGESEIRRWIIEHDWLEAVVALPDELFFNTNIATYFWLVTNRKSEARRGRIQLIDARSFWEPMPRSLGKKRKQITDAQRAEVVRIHQNFEDGPYSRIMANEAFGYRRLAIEKPRRVRYEVSEEALAILAANRTFQNVGRSTRRARGDAILDDANGDALRAAVLTQMRAAIGAQAGTRAEARVILANALAVTGLTPALREAILDATAVDDVDGEAVADARGRPVMDADLTDYERIPLDADAAAFIEAEVVPFSPDAQMNADKERIGYELPVTRIFYRYEPPRALEQIDREILDLERELDLLIEETATTR
jgi:type I restriction enzyme M protein